MDMGLYNKYMEAIKEYQKLRDAKSNGCCHNMTIREVTEYDKKIEMTVETMNSAKEAYMASISDVGARE